MKQPSVSIRHSKIALSMNCTLHFFFLKLTENSLYNDERYFGKVHVETIPFQLEYEVYQNENI